MINQIGPDQGFSNSIATPGVKIATIKNPDSGIPIGAAATAKKGDAITLTSVAPTDDASIPLITAKLRDSNQMVSQGANGYSEVTDSDGNRLSAQNGELFGYSKDGSRKAVPLGSINDPKAWDAAIDQGFTDKKGRQTLMQLEHGGFMDIPELQAQFGGGGSTDDKKAGVAAVIDQLQQNAQKSGVGEKPGTTISAPGPLPADSSYATYGGSAQGAGYSASA